jgi:hypothetical protein
MALLRGVLGVIFLENVIFTVGVRINVDHKEVVYSDRKEIEVI